MAGVGTGSPIAFRCAEARRGPRHLGDRADHIVDLTGRTRPYSRRRGTVSRGECRSREYRCSCGHVGWSNHSDLARLAGAVSR